MCSTIAPVGCGITEGEKRHTSHFSTYDELTQAEGEKRVLLDGNVLTSRGAGTAVEFGLVMVRPLIGKTEAQEVAAAIMA